MLSHITHLDAFFSELYERYVLKQIKQYDLYIIY